MGDDDEIRRVLLEHSDHRAIRNVFGERTGGDPASIADYVEAVRVTNGDLALVANEGAADIYARWDGSRNRYEHLSVWPPWSITGYDHADRSGLIASLRSTDDVRVTPHGSTPFADEQVLASLSNRIGL